MLHQPQGKGTQIAPIIPPSAKETAILCGQGNFIYCLADDGALHCFSQDGAVLKTLAVRFAASSVQTPADLTRPCAALGASKGPDWVVSPPPPQPHRMAPSPARAFAGPLSVPRPQATFPGDGPLRTWRA